jgi:hypothetical protein
MPVTITSLVPINTLNTQVMGFNSRIGIRRKLIGDYNVGGAYSNDVLVPTTTQNPFIISRVVGNMPDDRLAFGFYTDILPFPMTTTSFTFTNANTAINYGFALNFPAAVGSSTILPTGALRLQLILNKAVTATPITPSYVVPTDKLTLMYDSVAGQYIFYVNGNSIYRASVSGITSLRYLALLGDVLINAGNTTTTQPPTTTVITSASAPSSMLFVGTKASGVATESAYSVIDGQGITTAKFEYSYNSGGLATDLDGNIYVSTNAKVIHRITPSGQVNVIAGAWNTAGYNPSVYNTIATSARFWGINALRYCPLDGKLWFSDKGNLLSLTLATPPSSYGYVNLEYTAAQLGTTNVDIRAIDWDFVGNLYFANGGHNSVFKIDRQTGIISRYAGILNGGAFGNQTATLAINAAVGPINSIIIDRYNGFMYISTNDHFLYRINMAVSPATIGYIGTNTISGNPVGGYVDGVVSTARFNYPYQLALDGNQNLYIADAQNGRVRSLTLNAGATSTLLSNYTVSTFSGGGTATPIFAGGTNIRDDSYFPGWWTMFGLVIDTRGNMYVQNSSATDIKIIKISTLPYLQTFYYPTLPPVLPTTSGPPVSESAVVDIQYGYITRADTVNVLLGGNRIRFGKRTRTSKRATRKTRRKSA